MSDDVDTDDPSREIKHSRRALWKDAISKTKSKFKKSESVTDFKLSDDVNEFLSAGRIAPTARLSNGLDVDESSRDPSTSKPAGLIQPHQSLRRIVVPRLDVSQSPRWPDAKSFSPQLRTQNDDFLQPNDVSHRSQSLSSLKKRRSKPRKLSVSFINSPPTIIGEGGEAADAPPAQISWARDRSRSLSPMVNRPSSNHSGSNVAVNSQEQLTIHRKPVPSPVPFQFNQDSSPKHVHRVQTGLDTNIRSLADREFEQILQLTPTPDSAGGNDSHFKTPLFSPKPLRTSVVPPEVPTDSPTVDFDSPAGQNLLSQHQTMPPTNLDVKKHSPIQQRSTHAVLDSLPLQGSPGAMAMQPRHALAYHNGTVKGKKPEGRL